MMETADELAIWQQLYETPVLFSAIIEATGSELQRQAQLRQQYPAELVRLGLELQDLRQKAKGKFSRAERMWFTRQSLEQASGEAVARYKAERFRNALGPKEAIHDLCTGCGIDAIALAEIAPIITYDQI